MKAPAFWYQPESVYARLLAPLSAAYRFGAAWRKSRATPYRAAIPVICVGNVTAGGSGKTPTALALAALLQKDGHRPAFVTRGHGGSERGPLRVDMAKHNAAQVGDEALLLGRQAPVWIGRDRAAAIRAAETEATHIILDDGLQNPHIAPDISLLTVDAGAGFGNGHIIPAGPLREPLADALDRVKAVLVIGDGDVPQLRAFAKPVLRARLRAAMPDAFPCDANFLAFAGIGRPEKFYDLCRNEGLKLAATRDFADHHVFSRAECNALLQDAKNYGVKLLTTEKDFVRLPPDMREQVLTFPVRLEFEDEDQIRKIIYSTAAPKSPF